MKNNAKPTARSGAERLLSSLAEHGVDYFFFNPGTDFAPIIEAFAGNRKSNNDAAADADVGTTKNTKRSPWPTA